MARISRSRRRRGVSGGSPGSRQLFLERDDRRRPLQLPLESAVLRLELFHARVDVAGRRPPATPAHLPQGARLALPPPVRQQRRVQPLAPQQGAHLAGLLAGVGLLENAEPIFCGEARRWTVAGTSGSGSGAPDVVTGPGRPVALWAPSAPAPRPRPAPRLLACESSLRPSPPLH